MGFDSSEPYPRRDVCLSVWAGWSWGFVRRLSLSMQIYVLDKVSGLPA